MTQPRTKAARWDNTLLNQGTAPPSTSRVLAPAAPLEEQRGSYCSKEELFPTTAAAPAATAYRSTEGLEGTSPPITLVSLARTLMDPPNADSTDDLRGDVGAHPQPRTPSPGAASGGSGESSREASDTAGPLPCPRVPPMVLTLLVATALVQGFSASAISLFINMELKLGPVEVARYWMYIGYTAWCQPAIGYLSDALVLCGEKRRPLFVLAALGNTVIFLLYCATPQVTSSYGSFVAMSLCSQFFTMGLYIPLNGLVVEVGRHDAESAEESMARMSAIMAKTMVWRSTGSLIGNILQAFLVLRLSVPALLGVTGGLFALLVPIVLFTPRKLFLRAGTRSDNFYKRVAEAARLVYRSFDIHDVRSDGVCFLLVLAFVFVYTLMPDASSVYYNYLYGAYTFPTWFYALNNCIGYVGSIAGAYVFSLWMDHRARQEARGGKRTSLFFIFMIGSFAWAFGYVTNLLLCTGVITNSLGISAAVYVPVDTFFVSMFVRFAFMPTLTMAAEHAPKFFEATTFEVFSVASIGGGTISSLLTSIMAQELGIRRTDYSRLWILIVVSIALKLVPIPLAYLLPERRTGVVEQPTIEDGDAGAEENAAGVRVGGRPRQLTESARVSGESGDDDDPSMPLNGRHRNLI